MWCKFSLHEFSYLHLQECIIGKWLLERTRTSCRLIVKPIRSRKVSWNFISDGKRSLDKHKCEEIYEKQNEVYFFHGGVLCDFAGDTLQVFRNENINERYWRCVWQRHSSLWCRCAHIHANSFASNGLLNATCSNCCIIFEVFIVAIDLQIHHSC